MTTKGDVIFSGNMKRHFFPLDFSRGKLLWELNLSDRGINSSITCLVNGKQQFLVSMRFSIIHLV